MAVKKGKATDGLFLYSQFASNRLLKRTSHIQLVADKTSIANIMVSSLKILVCTIECYVTGRVPFCILLMLRLDFL